MEEILASIRRIIEDSDARPDGVATAPPEQDEADADLATFRAELAQEDMAQDAGSSPAGAAEVLTAAPHAVASRDRNVEPGLDAGLPEPTPPASQIEAAQNTAAEAGISPFASVEPIVPAEEVDSAEDATSRAGILSDAASRQVAASFGELSDAFSASRRRSFDEIAEEMLRPMLQDWLDNNLPVLVERLVREEIERVARGGSR